ncbi:50S ribosomal protein L3 [Candidatus Falkowbacteria bacterium RIFOXYB2_FULL_34_18]|uniref:Large ribosomal subunit protein uL3 n=1 Tax=Candidatus Falkowbacteria bacterium RIFOXYD2_FULL_34_120 TaxID=1798007 RepID=A0A1F5TSP4_9BACT|nr:MAG: 50S ribosomal protein L3 [Candidatus Falkowbacteria bacterium RIFOXYB2_FULL_34_18]OGF30068.1 MAG: 50S ribosomal protein L3 [Candidatus Falkowbacteria bacterium RIFOXYC12_FULL_34_55]OGF37599.1 MAG: 50S ribosomal protein L3 [Candidatus Falkowbacteria bacterium RIFOXYC2_FULL_34_220]OGF39354.1 MAG: 50S ribosomal protein L3 [Candidatus Falkowbacteria bacterium RIFOXYD12_FULL_34_57]OGF41859.1 MAG: 50S ribosomal protein L3 [Candidatus Falkowbacteria bacterium RIFOXYD2_FULL_34_120]
MKFIIGKKIEMTQVWKNDDEVVAVTRVQAGPCTVTQTKTKERDGYVAVQLGYGEKKEKNIRKPQRNHLKGLGDIRFMREFRVEAEGLNRGDIVDVSSFEVGDIVEVVGVSKGKGFQGVVKRHGFKGTKATHGNKDQLRMPGSVGATGPAHIFKGTRMGGRMGNDQVTIKNLEIVEIDKENNIISVKGALPGARNSLVLIQGKGEMKIVESPKPKVESQESEKKDDKIQIENKEQVKTSKEEVKKEKTEEEK